MLWNVDKIFTVTYIKLDAMQLIVASYSMLCIIRILCYTWFDYTGLAPVLWPNVWPRESQTL